MSVAIEIAVEAGDWAELPGAIPWVRRAVKAALADARVRGGELGVVLTDDTHIRALNRQWRTKDESTNVLSFPSPQTRDTGTPLIGDVVLAFETLMREARSEGKEAEHHLAHLAVHGVLHLLGHDHDDDKKAERMENRERAILVRLGVPDPYAADRAAGGRIS